MLQNDIIYILDKKFRLYLTPQEIATRVTSIAEQINRDYRDQEPLLLSILSGSFMFTADLVRGLSVPHSIEFVRYSSYSGTSSTGQISKVLGLRSDIQGKDIIIVEDIIDTGFTISTAIRELMASTPQSIRVASLLFKPTALKHQVPLDYIGFEIPNRFVVGYGLDYDERGRNLPAIYSLAEK